MRRWLKRLAVVVLLLLIAGIGWYAYYHHQITAQLNKALAELDRMEPGWRIQEIEAARAVVPDAENSARVVVSASKLLPRGWPSAEFADLLKGREPTEQFGPDEFAQLCQELDAVRPALNEARKLAGLPTGRHRIHYQPNWVSMPLDDQQKARQVVALLHYDALRRAQGRDPKSALTDCRAILNAARSLGDEPTFISQLVRNAGVTIACETAERVLAQSEPGAEGLAALQRALEEEDRFNGLWVGMRGERALQHEFLTAVENGTIPLEERRDADEFAAWRERLLGWRARDRFRAEHPQVLSLLTRTIEIARLPLHEQIEAERDFERAVQNLPRSAALTQLMLMPVLDRPGAAERRKHACIRSMVVALTVERYRQKHGAWPKSLGKLTPDLLKEVPLDPFDGKPLRYRRRPDGAAIYSVGEDGTDDGGTLFVGNPKRSPETDRPEGPVVITFPREPQAPGKDLGYRLWDVKHRRQPPRPPEPPRGAPD